MKYLSICSGIEAASVAWLPLGWNPIGFSEIEPFPSAVLKHHYPHVPNYGDMTAIAERIKSGEIQAPDLLCGGTPCQAFSVAGLRKSLDDARGNLTLTFCEIADAIDNVRHARNEPESIIFWENVPGVLNTKDNAFGCFLAAIAGENQALIPSGGKWTNAGCVFGPKRAIAWRVLDAQYFGVAQRRRRVFVVASARDDFNPAKVLFEWEGVRRDTAPSREARQSVAGTVARCASDGGDTAPTVTSKWSKLSGGPAGSISELGNSVMIPHAFKIRQGCEGGGKGYLGQDDLAFTLSTHQDQQVAQSVTFSTPAIGHVVRDDVASTITKNTGAGGETQNPAYVAQPVTYDLYNVTAPVNRQSRTPGDPCHTLARANAEHAAVVSPSLTASNDPSRSPQSSEVTQQVAAVHAATMAVRRLTPVECERLQGFPDNYTNIPWRKSAEAPDGPRYKALGNSWAVPVVNWIGQKIKSSIGE